MPSLNKVMIIGNLTRDPEVRFTPKGTAVADIGLAVNSKTKDSSGNKIESTVFLDVVLWNKTAELAGEYLKKGRPVFIEGRLHLETWDDKQTGHKRSRLKIIGEEMQFLGIGNGDGKPSQRDDGQSAKSSSIPSRAEFEDDADIPF